VPITGGRPQTLAAAPYFSGGAWGSIETIVYAPSFTHGLWRVSADGGPPERLTTPAAGTTHVWPDMIAGGRDVVFTIYTGTHADEAQLAVLSLDTRRYEVLLHNGFFGRFAGPHRIVFTRGGRLMSVAYDPRQRRVVGTPIVVQPEVMSNVAEASSLFAATATTLAFAAHPPRPPRRTLKWVNRSGSETAAIDVPQGIAAVRLSPDAARFVSTVVADTVSLWTSETTPGARPRRVTVGSDDHSTAWSPDGGRIAFESGRDGFHRVFVRAADGSGEDRAVTGRDTEHHVGDWSPDGRVLAVVEFTPDAGTDIVFIDLQTGAARRFAATRAWEREPAFSPDGQFLAYVSDQSGRDEIYVQRIDEPTRLQVSDDGGTEPVWSRSGRELFFRGSGQMLAVTVTPIPAVTAGRPVALFRDLYFLNRWQSRTYDVGPDDRFLMVKDANEIIIGQIEIVLNWVVETPEMQ
jgi:hypothetical protein